MLGLVALVVCARRQTLSPCPRSCFVVARRCHGVVAVAGERPFVFVSGRPLLFGWLWVVVGTARRVVVGVESFWNLSGISMEFLWNSTGNPWESTGMAHSYHSCGLPVEFQHSMGFRWNPAELMEEGKVL